VFGGKDGIRADYCVKVAARGGGETRMKQETKGAKKMTDEKEQGNVLGVKDMGIILIDEMGEIDI